MFGLEDKKILVTGGSGGIGIASAIVFLLGSSAAMVTGVSLPIDGGFTTC